MSKTRPTTIIIPIDRNHPTLRTLELYYRTISSENYRIIFVHVIQPGNTNSLFGIRASMVSSVTGNPVPIKKKVLVEAKLLCREHVQHAQSHGLKAKSVIYVNSHVGPALIQAAARYRADLFLLWTQERVCGDITGEIYQHVHRHSPIPMVLLPRLHMSK
ncbi:unnamed protein product [Echinostoma caproni]|uniref:Usp domain-containing protein n=1 Tax=Echinostoma caproni TaxID=27848 RepID=A0A183B1T5_9TREM|nr:unnamed protein product [Echinostoma caproni]